MRRVILRDDDTNALTPIDCLERLYRPFLQQGLPVNLAVIPNVSTEASYLPGQPEKFLLSKNGPCPKYLPIGSNAELTRYLRANPLFKIVQHGCSHESVAGHREFDHSNRRDIALRLHQGRRYLSEAGLGKPAAFVAPYDQLSTVSLREVAKRFPVLSTGWFELRRLPPAWWPRYLWKRMTGAPHWRAGKVVMLSHPGCHLSYHRSYSLMLQEIEQSIDSRGLTVLVTHWWEYFRNGVPDLPFIEILHKTADYLASRNDVEVISFADVARQKVPLN